MWVLSETVTNPLHPQKISSRPLVVSFRELSYFGNPFWTDFQISLGDRLQVGAYRLQIGSSQYEVDTEVISGTTDANLFLPTRFLVVLHRFDPIIYTPPAPHSKSELGGQKPDLKLHLKVDC